MTLETIDSGTLFGAMRVERRTSFLPEITVLPLCPELDLRIDDPSYFDYSKNIGNIYFSFRGLLYGF